MVTFSSAHLKQEAPTESQGRLLDDSIRHIAARTMPFRGQWPFAAFSCIPGHDYSAEKIIEIGDMSVSCQYCGAKKWKKETLSMCCSWGKVHLPWLQDPPEPLRHLLMGDTPQSQHFLASIRNYNSSFQMTSFGANIIR